MERSEKREKVSFDEMLKREQEEENEEVLVVSFGQEVEGQEELEVSDTEDEEEEGTTPLITACRKGLTEVSSCTKYECVREFDMRLCFVV